MPLNIHTIGATALVLICLGVLVGIIGIIFYIGAGSGISLGKPEDNLHAHDTYFVIVHGLGRLLFLSPSLAGILLILSGALMRYQANDLNNTIAAAQSFSTEEAPDAPYGSSKDE